MPKMIGCCGLVCTDCPAYLATLKDDNAQREIVARYYAEVFGLNYKPEDINCEGCLSESEKRIEFCKACEIRKCCLEKKVENCAICKEQVCETLAKFHELSPESKACFQRLLKEK